MIGDGSAGFPWPDLPARRWTSLPGSGS